MRTEALLFAALLTATSAIAAQAVLLETPVRVIAEVQPGTAPNTTKLELSVQHGASEFVLNVVQHGAASAAVEMQKAMSGWKDGYLFIRDNCPEVDQNSPAWRCVVDHVFTLAEDARDKSGVRLIYVGEVFAGEDCVEAPRVGCALYKGTFTDIYDRLENNPLLPRAESPALLIESSVRSGVFAVDLEETWKANQERFLAGARCLFAKQELQKELCIDGITPRRAYLFNTALATYTRQDETLARTRSFARAALCEPERLAEAECSEVLRASALLLASVKPGEKARPRGSVSSSAAKDAKTKP